MSGELLHYFFYYRERIYTPLYKFILVCFDLIHWRSVIDIHHATDASTEIGKYAGIVRVVNVLLCVICT